VLSPHSAQLGALHVPQLPDERARLSTDIDELTRHVDAVIREARRTEREGAHAACDVTAVVREHVATWQALADDQGRPTRTAVPDNAMSARLTADDLGAALDALLGNVMAHTDESTAFAVTVERALDGFVRVVVEDGGPGLPAGDLMVRGRSDSGSTGLGLDIVRRTAEASGGSVTADRSPDLGGARITMLLGPPTA